MATSFLFVLTAVRLYVACIIPSVTVTLLCVVIQSCKLLHLWGIPSSGIFSCLFLLGSYSLPFIVPLGKSGGNGNAGISVDSNEQLKQLDGLFQPRLLLYQGLLLFTLPTVATAYFSGHKMMHLMLMYWTNRLPNSLEAWCGCLSLYLLYCAVLVLMFFRRRTLMRRCAR